MISSESALVPRLSEAAHLLPTISNHLEAAARRNPHCASLRLIPVVEDGLFGYELVPNLDTHTYLIIGRDAQSRPALRTVSYSNPGPEPLQLVAVQGRLLSRRERASRYSVQSRYDVFADWQTAASAACQQLQVLFPHPHGEPYDASRLAHRHLEEALRIAHLHLGHFDPFIEFFGLPNEAQLGFPLCGLNGKHGELAFREPNIWIVQWRCGDDVIAESWSIDAQQAVASIQHDRRSQPDRRIHRRRAADRGEVSVAWQGMDRRRPHGRRATDAPY